MVLRASWTLALLVSMTMPSRASTMQEAWRFLAGGLTCSTTQMRQAPYWWMPSR